MQATLPTIAIGTDHAGFALKEAILHHLREKGYTVKDFGTFSDVSCDYPDFVRPAAEAVAAGHYTYGIVLGGSGNGEAIVANKVPGVRCGLVWNTWTAEMTRAHNDANVMSLGARTISEADALEAVDVFLSTPFEGGRHCARVEKIESSPLHKSE